MRHTCDLADPGRCGKPAVDCIEINNQKIWVCADHFDQAQKLNRQVDGWYKDWEIDHL